MLSVDTFHDGECEQLLFVSVVIPTFHDWERLQLCIDALHKQTYPRDRYEVIIVNNDPDDIPPRLALNDSLTLISESKPGSYAARNSGIQASRGEVLAFTDSDCIPDPDWLTNGVAALNQKFPRIAGKVELFYAANKLTFVEIYEKTFEFRQDKCANEFCFGVTANMLTYRSVFNAVGRFNEDLFSGGDSEWGQRSECEGFSIKYCNNAIVLHPSRKSFQEIINKSRRIVGGKYIRTNKKKRFVVKSLVLNVLPPVVVSLEIFKRSDITKYEKIVALMFYYFIKLVKNVELVRLAIGGNDPERH